MKIYRTHTHVIFETDFNVYSFSQECNIQPHPRNSDKILITEIGTTQKENEAFAVNWANLTNRSNTPLGYTTRENAILQLTQTFFDKNYMINKTRYADTIGDGTGNIHFIGNYTAVSKALIKAGSIPLFIKQMTVFLSTSGNVISAKYGDITLTNGIKIVIETEGGVLIKDITNAGYIKTSGDFLKLGFDVTDLSVGAGLNYMQAKIDYCKNGVHLFLNPGTQLAFYLNDNFTGLTEHTIRIGCYSLE